MEPIRVTLCPECGNCPTVEITDDGVRIGEGEKTAELTVAQWNDLVDRIRSGDLPRR